MRKVRCPVWVGVAVLTVSAVALGQATPDLTVAVLDFESVGSDQEMNWLQFGLPLMLAADLANLEGVRVLEREQPGPLLKELRLREGGLVRGESLTAAAKGLGADVVVLGSYKQEDSQVTLETSIFDTASGEERHIPPISGQVRDTLALAQGLFRELALVLELDMTKVRHPPQAKPSQEKVSLAVMPFLSMSPASADVSGDALADLVAAELSEAPAVTLVERERVRDILREFQLSAAGFSAQIGKLVEAGNMLGAEAMLLGSYTTVGPDLRIDARLVRVPSGEMANVMSVQGSRHEPAEVMEKLALAAASRLRVAPPPGSEAEMEKEGTRNLEAHLYYRMAQEAETSFLRVDAVRHYQQVAYVDPDFRNIHLWIGVALYKLGNSTQALELFEAHLPSYIDKGTVSWYWFVRIPLQCYLRLEQFDKALEFEETITRVFPEPTPKTKWGTIESSETRREKILKYKQAVESQVAGAPAKFAEAQKKLAEATNDMERYEAKLALAEACQMSRKTEDAIAAYKEAFASFPGSEKHWIVREFSHACWTFAVYCHGLGRTGEARQYYLLAAKAKEESGDKEEAIKPGRGAGAYDQAASCYGRLGDSASTRRLYRKAALAYATSGSSKGMILAEHRLRDPDLTTVVKNRMLTGTETQGDNPHDYERRAQAYFDLGMREEAAAEVRKFLDQYPDHKDPSRLWRFITLARPLRQELVDSIVQLYFRNLDRAAYEPPYGRRGWAARMLSDELAKRYLQADRHKRLYVIGLILSDEFSDLRPVDGECYKKAALYLRARDRGEEVELNAFVRDYRILLDSIREDMSWTAFSPVRRTPKDEKDLEWYEAALARFHEMAKEPEADTEQEFQSWLSEEIIPMIEDASQRNQSDPALTKLLCRLYFLRGDSETSDRYFRDALAAAPDKSAFMSAIAEFYEDEGVAERAKEVREHLEDPR